MTNWSGYGILALIIIFGNALIIDFIAGYVIGEDNKSLIPMGTSCLLSALMIKLVANYFRKKKEQRKGTYVFDWVTIANEKENKFYYIPFAQWPYILAVLGIIIIVCQLITSARKG